MKVLSLNMPDDYCFRLHDGYRKVRQKGSSNQVPNDERFADFYYMCNFKSHLPKRFNELVENSFDLPFP